jgi:hypothetical protein
MLLKLVSKHLSLQARTGERVYTIGYKRTGFNNRPIGCSRSSAKKTFKGQIVKESLLKSSERRGQVGSTSASFLGGPGFESEFRDPLS